MICGYTSDSDSSEFPQDWCAGSVALNVLEYGCRRKLKTI